MSNTTISPNMNLIVPTVGVEPGPDWASDLNSDLGILDQHDHTSGKGVQISPAGININSDLAINSNNLTTVKTINFSAQGSSLAGSAPDLGCVYVGGNELYYNDEAGNVVQITNNGAVNAGAGSITGLPSGTASASFSSGTFIWQSATNTPANTDTGSVIYRNAVANSKGLTLNPPNSMSVNYTLTLPIIPAALSFVTLDTSGNFSGAIPTSAGITGANIALATITGSNIAAATIAIGNMAANSVGTTQIVDQNVTQAKLQARPSGTSVAAGGVAISSSSGAYVTTSGTRTIINNFSITITTTGRPVRLAFQDDGSGSNSFIASDTLAGTIATGEIDLKRGSTTLTEQNIQISSSAGSRIQIPVSSIDFLDMGVNGAAGTYTYTAVASTNSSLTVQNARFVAYEI